MSINGVGNSPSPLALQTTQPESTIPTRLSGSEPTSTQQTPTDSGTSLSDDVIASQFGISRHRDSETVKSPAADQLGAVSSATGPAGPFATADAAAIAILDRANPLSIRDNVEYGGLIYKDSEGHYWSTAPAKGDGDSFDPTSVSIPAGTTLVGDYHTHADYSLSGPNGPIRTSDPQQDDYNSDNFSQTDLRGIRMDANGKDEYTGYLGTPSGDYKRFDPSSGSVTTIKQG